MKGSRSISRTPGNAVLRNHFRLKVIFGKAEIRGDSPAGGGNQPPALKAIAMVLRTCSAAWFETPASQAPHREGPGLGAKKGGIHRSLRAQRSNPSIPAPRHGLLRFARNDEEVAEPHPEERKARLEGWPQDNLPPTIRSLRVAGNPPHAARKSEPLPPGRSDCATG